MKKIVYTVTSTYGKKLHMLIFTFIVHQIRLFRVNFVLKFLKEHTYYLKLFFFWVIVLKTSAILANNSLPEKTVHSP